MTYTRTKSRPWLHGGHERAVDEPYVIDVYGDPPTYLRAGLRTAGNLVSIGTLFLGFLWIGFDAEKRGLHDWIAGTYVIRAP